MGVDLVVGVGEVGKNMKKNYFYFLLCILVLGVGGYFLSGILHGVAPVIKGPPDNIADLIENASSTSSTPGKNSTDVPLTLPDNFEISILAKKLKGARVLAVDKNGDVWVSRTSEGIISFVDLEKGKVVNQIDVFKNLKRPHGLIFDPKDEFSLYIAEEQKISKASFDFSPQVYQGKSDADKIRTYLQAASQEVLQKVVDLPKGGRHFTRTLAWGGDGKLYVTIGSTCNVCEEKNPQNATVMRVNMEERKLEPVATGLRNAPFIALNPTTQELWVTEMGRDFLGDDTPPDEIDIIHEGKNYGWPICYGKNIHDSVFDTKKYIQDPCKDKEPSAIDLPAHSAPLGLTFIPKEGWPPEYQSDLLVAYHGSFNRKEPTGYKIVRFDLQSGGKEENFVSGWLTEKNAALGRPVDVLAVPGGILYVSDDKAGVVYKLKYISP